MISLSTPVTGSAQTGLTSPTFTHVTDQPPATVSGKQHAVTALGGTQTDVRTHSTSDPFTITFERPQAIKPAPLVNANGVITAPVGNNVYIVRVRKGVRVYDTQTRIASMETYIRVPSGADSVDPQNIRAMLSCGIGALTQVSAGIGDTSVTNVV